MTTAQTSDLGRKGQAVKLGLCLVSRSLNDIRANRLGSLAGDHVPRTERGGPVEPDNYIMEVVGLKHLYNRGPIGGIEPSKKLQRKAKKDYTIEEKQSFLAQLNTYAETKNMKRGRGGCYGWAIYAYADKFGCRPTGRVNWGARSPIGQEVQDWITHRNIAYANRRNA